MEPRRWRGRGRLHEHVRRQARLDLSAPGRLSAPAFNWLRFPHDEEHGTEPTPEWPLESVLDAVAAAGFGAVGLDSYTLAAHAGTAEDVAALLTARGLRCSDVGIVAVGDLDRAALEPLAHVARVLGAPLCIAALFRDVPHEDAVRDLRTAAEVFAPMHVRLAFEFTAYGHRRTLAAAAAVCQEVGWDACGLLVDTWHVFRGGESLSSLGALADGRIALVHVNDGTAVPDPDPVFEGRFRRLLPGTGSFDLTAFAAALAAVGYDGPVSPEVLSAELRRLKPLDAARLLLESLAFV